MRRHSPGQSSIETFQTAYNELVSIGGEGESSIESLDDASRLVVAICRRARQAAADIHRSSEYGSPYCTGSTGCT